MMLSLIVTGAILYLPSLAIRVGHRGLIENIHVITGLCLLGPLLVGIAGPWRKQLSGRPQPLRPLEAVRLRLVPEPCPPLRASPATSSTAARRSRPPSSAPPWWPPSSRESSCATRPRRGSPVRRGRRSCTTPSSFAIVVAVLAHIAFALSRPDQFVSMFNGRIPRAWAKSHAEAWLSEIEAPRQAGRDRYGWPGRQDLRLRLAFVPPRRGSPRVLAVARGDEPADLVIKGGSVFVPGTRSG